MLNKKSDHFRPLLLLSQIYFSIGRYCERVAQINWEIQPFVWSDECQIAFDTLRQRLINAPILAYPKNEGLFIIDTDASKTYQVSVLSQI